MDKNISDKLKVLDSLGVKHLGKKIGTSYIGYMAERIAENPTEPVQIFIFGPQNLSALKPGDSILLFNTVTDSHSKSDALAIMYIDGSSTNKLNIHIRCEGYEFVGEMSFLEATDQGSPLGAGFAGELAIERVAKMSDIPELQSGAVKTIILKESEEKWYPKGNENADLSKVLQEGDIVILENYYNPLARIPATPDPTYVGVGIVNRIEQDMMVAHAVVFGDESTIYNATLRFNGYYSKSGYSLGNFLTSATASSTYQKKADMPIAKYTGTITPASAMDAFAGASTSIKDVVLTVSPSSATLKAGDIIETSDKVFSVQVLSMTSGTIRAILSGVFCESPYYATLTKQSDGSYKGYCNIIQAGTFTRTMSQSSYDSLATKDPNTIYYITE